MEEADRRLEASGIGKTARLWLVLDSIQDPMNFGAVLRSAYFLGVDRVCAVKENSCSLSPVVSKASAGVLELLPIYRLDSLTEFLKTCRDDGWQILGTVGKDTGTTEDPRVVSLRDARINQDTLLILGNEGAGLSSDVTDQCHQLLTIEPRHQLDPCVDSLNVSVATGILLHQLVSTIVEGPDVGKIDDDEADN
ncbi:rRNA methyltransferase 1, mitochondrial [Lamellibrachia satsuma]|nr:rRNA methyltransferase 1, mitochondrial [Lamellibrachia satsuma]